MTDASFWSDLIAPSFTSSGISHPLSFNPFSSFTPQFTPQFTPHDVSFSWQPSAPYRQTWTADEQKSDELATVFGVGLEQDRAFSETSGGHPGLGEFVVGDRGQLQIDLVFDGGSYAGQLAVFSLIGMETLRPGSLAYIQEATRRALSQSHQGYGIVSDTEGAKLTGSVVTGELTPAPRPSGSPSYPGHAGPNLTPGDRMAFMLIPNGTVQAAFSAAIATSCPAISARSFPWRRL
ncbi:MAG: hypothetical protein HC857_13130, partial [Synechococcales cyanobacterium RU_4_20]|nr:hypothetical protein [Synechococcales cyanobacterium RU_4_20]